MSVKTKAQTSTAAIDHRTFAVELMQNRELVPHLGSMLRGAFGHALMALACCHKTPHATDCIYQSVFEPAAPSGWPSRFSDCPPAYVITPPAYGSVERKSQYFQFNMTLLGVAPSFGDVIEQAWHQAGLNGLGRDRVKARIHCIQRTAAQPVTVPGRELSLRITTPMMLKQHSSHRPRHYRLAASEVTFDAILRALHRRLELVQRLYDVPAEPLPTLEDLMADGAALNCRTDLSDVDFRRHSNRQRRDMPLAGVIGHLRLDGAISPRLTAALALGQWLHIGGKTSFGLGAYKMSFLDAPGVRLYLEA